MSVVDEKDLASVKCYFNGESRVVRVPTDVRYNALMLKVAETFGMPLIVETYEDVEGERITINAGGIIDDLAAQLSYGSKRGPYAIKLYLKAAEHHRIPNHGASPTPFADRRSSSGASDDYNRAKGLPLGALHSATTGLRRRDSKSLAIPDDGSGERRLSNGDAYPRRLSAVEHVRQTSSGEVGRRSSVDSDGDIYDEVLLEGAPWEPPFSRTPHDANPLDGTAPFVPREPIAAGRGGPGGFGMTVEIPKNPLHNNMLHGASVSQFLDPNAPDTPGSTSSAMKTPTMSPISPFAQKPPQDSRFPAPDATTPSLVDSGTGHAATVVIVPPLHHDEPFLRSISSNGSTRDSEHLPSFHQQPFPEEVSGMLTTSPVGAPQGGISGFGSRVPNAAGGISISGSGLPVSANLVPGASPQPLSPSHIRGHHHSQAPQYNFHQQHYTHHQQPYFPNSEDIEQRLRDGPSYSSSEEDSDPNESRDYHNRDSDPDHVDVVDSDRNRGQQQMFAFPPVSPSSPPLPNAQSGAQQANSGGMSTDSPRTRSTSSKKSVDSQPTTPTGAPSPRTNDLRSGMKPGSGKSRRATSVSSAGGLNSSAGLNSSSGVPKPLNLAWKKGDLIGRGGFGSVYKGLLSNGQSVAVKCLELPPDVDPTKSSTYVSFLKEIDMLKALKHPNIVRYIGSTIEGSTINVFLELVSGGSIASMVTKYGTFDEPMMKLFARHILCALAYLHENNIAHRDVKGANILVDNEGIAKLADFGCSKSISVKSGGIGPDNTHTMLGTPFWMAPEVMRQERQKSILPADIWSFGCTLIEMASGRPPWAKEYTQIFALLYEVGNSSKIPDIPAGLSPELQDLLRQCFRRTPTERPTAAALLRHPWFDDVTEDYADSDESADGEEGTISSLKTGTSVSPSGGLGANALNAFSTLKKKSFNLAQSISASRSQALQEKPKSLDALPEKILLRILSMCTLSTVANVGRSCARFRFLAQRNTVWASLATAQWPKLNLKVYGVDSSASDSTQKNSNKSKERANAKESAQSIDVAEVDFAKRIFMGFYKYDVRFTADPLFRHVRTVKGHTKKVHALQLLEGGAKLVTAAGDKKIKIWEIATPIPVPSTSPGAAPLGSVLSSPLGGSYGTLPSPTGFLGANGPKEGSTTTMSSISGSASTSTSGNSLMPGMPQTGAISGEEKSSLASSSSSISAPSSSSASSSSKKKKASITLRGHNAPVTCFHATSHIIISGSCDGMIKVWDLKSKKCTTSIRAGDHGITGLQMDEKANLFVTAATDGSVKLWDLGSLTPRMTLSKHRSTVHAIKFYGHVLATAGADKRVNIWNLKTGKLVHSLRGHTSDVLCVDIVGDTVIAGGSDGALLEWSSIDDENGAYAKNSASDSKNRSKDSKNGTSENSSSDGKKVSPSPRAYELPPGLQPSTILAVHFDGVNTVCAAREDGLVLFYRYHSGQFHSALRADSCGPVTALALSNQVLATAGYGEKLVKLWALVKP